MTILRTALDKLFRLRERSIQRPADGDGTGADSEYRDPHEKPFLDHLEDLRVMLMKVIIVQIVLTVGCFIFHKFLFRWMFLPLQMPYERLKRDDGTVLFDHIKFEFFAPPEGFMLSLKVSFFAALILAIPIHSFFIAQFVLPGLTAKEKKYIIPGVVVGFFLFLIGASFAFFGALPFAFDFLTSYNTGIIDQDGQSTWRTGYYIGFVSQVVLIFGLAFELPVVTTILVKLQLLTYRTMSSSRSFAIIILCVLSAVLTPPDPFTMVMLALPMIVLYEICVWIAFFMDRKREAREAVEEAEYQKWLLENEEKEKAAKAATAALPDSDSSTAATGDDDGDDNTPTPVSAAEEPYSQTPATDEDDYSDEYYDGYYNDGYDDTPSAEDDSFAKYGDHYGDLDQIECPEDRRNIARARKTRELAKQTEALSSLLVDINNGTIDELKSLPGIGPKTAQQIIDHRPYGSPDELLTLPGISESKFNAISLLIFAG